MARAKSLALSSAKAAPKRAQGSIQATQLGHAGAYVPVLRPKGIHDDGANPTGLGHATGCSPDRDLVLYVGFEK